MGTYEKSPEFSSTEGTASKTGLTEVEEGLLVKYTSVYDVGGSSSERYLNECLTNVRLVIGLNKRTALI